jgi:hypothetical protein
VWFRLAVFVLLCDLFICRSVSALGAEVQNLAEKTSNHASEASEAFTVTPRGRHYLTNDINPSVFEFDIASREVQFVVLLVMGDGI